MSEKQSTVEKLKKQREQLNARIEKMEATAKTRQRKQDAKRKILVGAYHLELAEKLGKLEELKSGLDKFLKRNSDRALFDLAPLAAEETKQDSATL